MKKAVLLPLALTGWVRGLFGIPQDVGKAEVFFCNQVDCFEVFKNKTFTGSIDCAFYHLSDSMKAYLRGANARLVVDEEHFVKNAVIERGSGLMHNKFCAINTTHVWTGSWNPSQGMSIPNNVVFIESETITNGYLLEFEELSKGVFHGGKSSPSKVLLNGRLAESYFCPEDDCKGQVLKAIQDAKKSVHFMTFSFTDDDLGKLIDEKRMIGIDVKGVFDPRKDKYSEFERLKEVSKIAKVHHKVFIIDGDTVITGSYNPSRNGDERNDENIIILREPGIVRDFEAEFERLYK